MKLGFYKTKLEQQNTIKDLPLEVFVLIFLHLDNYKDLLNFGLSCKQAFDGLLTSSKYLDIQINKSSRYYINILVNLINNFNFPTKNIKLLCQNNLFYMPQKVLVENEFGHINFGNLKKNQEIINTFIQMRAENLTKDNYSFEYTISDNDYTENHYYNNQHDDQASDYHESVKVKTYNIPWYVTKLKFTHDYKLVANVDQMSVLNHTDLPKEPLYVYDKNQYNNCVITTNCIDPQDNKHAWIQELKNRYKFLNEIVVSKKIIQVKNSSVLKSEFNLTNYSAWQDPMLKSEIIEKFLVITCIIFLLFCVFLKLIY